MTHSQGAARRRHRRIGAAVAFAALIGAGFVSDQRGLLALAHAGGGHPAIVPGAPAAIMPSAFAAIVPPGPMPALGSAEGGIPARQRRALGGTGFTMPAAVDEGSFIPERNTAFEVDPALFAPPAVDLSTRAPTPGPADAPIARGALGAIDPGVPAIRSPAAATVASVPEPASWMTLVAGFAALGVAQRRARAARPGARVRERN